MDRLLLDLSVNVTAMFRDPTFYKAFRDEVVPLLRTYPFIRIWHAGCSTGEEVYSMAILLEEEGLLRSRADLRDRHQRRRAAAARAAGSFRSTGCRSTPRTTSARAARARSPSTTRPSTTARCSARAHAERRLLAAQPGHRPVVQRVQRHPLPQRAHLLRPGPAASRADALLRQPRDLRRPRARQQGVAAVLPVRGMLRAARRAREDLPEGA